jgi:hypothetical protein
MVILELLKALLGRIKLVFKNINIGYNSGTIGDRGGRDSAGISYKTSVTGDNHEEHKHRN